MIEMSEIMQELACAVRQKNFAAADEALSIIAARCGYSNAIARGRREAAPHEPVRLSAPNIVTIHDLPSRDGIEVIQSEAGGSFVWREAGTA